MNAGSPSYRFSRWLSFPLLVVIIAFWQWQSSRPGSVAILLPPPMAIVKEFWVLLVSGQLVRHLGATLARTVSGFLLGGIPGFLLGLWLGYYAAARRVADPWIGALHAIPKVTLLPFFMIALGVGESSKIAVVAVSAFFPLLINSMAGVWQISPIHFEVARNCGARPLKIFIRVIFPGSLPLALAGARLSLNIALLLAITVEMIGATTGLGAMIWEAWQTLRVEDLYIGLVLAAALGVGIRGVISWLALRLTPWQKEATP